MIEDSIKIQVLGYEAKDANPDSLYEGDSASAALAAFREAAKQSKHALLQYLTTTVSVVTQQCLVKTMPAE